MDMRTGCHYTGCLHEGKCFGAFCRPGLISRRRIFKRIVRTMHGLRGHRIQFGLRTLLIGVTLLAVFCAYVARDVQIANQRIAYVKSHRGFIWRHLDREREHNSRVSYVRAICGDSPYDVVAMPLWSSHPERTVVRVLFPEAQIMAINPLYPASGGPLMDFPTMSTPAPQSSVTAGR